MTTTTTPDRDALLLRDDSLIEVVGGQVMERPPLGTYSVELASILQEHLGPFVRQTNLGRTIVEALFRINATTQYRPDLAFISDARWPGSRRSPRRQPWDVVPDLAVEVVSENDTAWEVLEKVSTYLGAGVRLVWLVYPNLDAVHVHDGSRQIRILTRLETLDGGEVVPGFQLPLEVLFQGDPAEEGDASLLAH